ncbi:reverse transcriptase-like protein [bacterium LRH843]|nr:reverse transcriptase-like protein [bacterium LRH843]
MNIRIEWTFQPLKSKQTYFMKSEFMRFDDALVLLSDLEKTGRLKEAIFIDEHDSTWTKKELQRYLKQFETEPHEVTAYIDGGYDTRSKKAGIGVAIYYKQHHKRWRIRFNDSLELLEDNNEAEYAALYKLIQQLELIGVHHQKVTIYLDSLVVCNQAAGEWPCFEEHYLRWLDRIDELANKIGLKLQYDQIDRALNKEADQLATQALKGIMIESKLEQMN